MTEPQLGDVSQLLRRIGRSSTPDVPDSDFGITALDLIFGPTHRGSHDVLAVATPQLMNLLIPVSDVSVGIPGLLAEQAASAGIVCLVIDEHAFLEGPWLGAASGGHHALAEDVFEAGREVRERGGNVLYIPTAHPVSGAHVDRIRSTATAVLTEIPDEHFDEDAPQSGLWRVCSDYARNSTR